MKKKKAIRKLLHGALFSSKSAERFECTVGNCRLAVYKNKIHIASVVGWQGWSASRAMILLPTIYDHGPLAKEILKRAVEIFE
jgi:hypothetical protein